MKPHLIIPVIFFLLGSLQGAGGEPAGLFQKTMNDFIQEALTNNPELKEALARIQSTEETPSQAGSLDDPQLQFELKNLPVDTFNFGQEAMTQKQITLSQKLPFPGKLGLKVDMAKEDVKIAREDYEELKLKIRRDVKLSFYELCFVLTAIEITNKNRDLLKQFVTIAETKYSVGKGIQQDVLKAQVELSQILDELLRLNERRRKEQAKLNTLMDRLPQAPLKISHGIKKTPFHFTVEQLQKMAEGNRPLLKKLQHFIGRSKHSASLARREFYPDFNLGLRYGSRQDGPVIAHPDFASAFFSINIPIWYQTKQKPKLAEEMFNTSKIEKAYHKTRNLIFLDIEERMDEEAKSGELIDLIGKGIIPQARQSLESAMAGYTVDKVDFLTLLDNQVTLFNWEIKHHRELTDYEKTLAKIEYAVGKKLY